MGVSGGPLGLDFGHLGAPGRSLWADFDHFRIPGSASGAKMCNFVTQHFNSPAKKGDGNLEPPRRNTPEQKLCFLRTSSALQKQKLLMMRPSTRGSKRQNAEPPCAGSNRVPSHTFLTGVLTARSAFMVRSASGYRYQALAETSAKTPNPRAQDPTEFLRIRF